MAEEIRAGLASLGMRSLDELTGRSDLLRQRDHPLSKTNGLDLSFISKFVGPCQKYSDRIEAKVSSPLSPQARRVCFWQAACQLENEQGVMQDSLSSFLSIT